MEKRIVKITLSGDYIVKLEKISEKTFGAVVKMKLPPEQNEFVAPNVYSLAQAWLYVDDARPFAIVNNSDVVGFIMLDWDEDERTVGIWRLMIAHEHQHRGYGRAALTEAIEMVKNTQMFDLIYLDYARGNTAARQLYYSLGFRENGKVEGDEIIMTLPITDKPQLGILKADMDDWDDLSELIAHCGNTSLLCNKEYLKKEIERENLKRYTVFGETVGISDGKEYLISPLFKEWEKKIKENL